MDDHDDTGDPLTTTGAHQMVAWTLRLAESHGFDCLLSADPHLFGLFYATCAAAVPAPELLAGEHRVGGVASEELLPTLKDLQRQFGHDTSGRFAGLYLQGVSVFPLLENDNSAYRTAVRAWRETAERKASQFVTSQERNVDWITDLLGLAPIERKLLIFLLNRHRPGFTQLFDSLFRFDHGTATVLAVVFDTTEFDIVSALSEDSRLIRSGLLHVQERPLRIAEPSIHLRAALIEPADHRDEFLERFVKPIAFSPSTGSLARLHGDDEKILRGILALPMPEDRGLHTLVYGPRSVDKRGMLSRLLREQNIDGYSVLTKHVPTCDLPTWVYIAQRHLEKLDPNAVLVVDRAHEALASRRISMFSILGMEDDDVSPEEDGRASDDGLTGSRVRCVWLTDRAKLLSERNLGAFLFHCEVLPGWKLEFKALEPEQAWSMFCTEAEFDSSSQPERAEELRKELTDILDLAPGDFATVKRQANMLGERLSPEAWLEQLAAEAKAKMFGVRRQQLGFASRGSDGA